MHLHKRGLLGLPDIPIVNEIGNGVKSVLRPHSPPEPTQTPAPPPPPPVPSPTQPSFPGKGKGNGLGNGNPGKGNGHGNGNGNGNEPPSQPAAGNPVQAPTESQPAPTQQPSPGSSPIPTDGQSVAATATSQPPSEPIQNLGTSPNGSTSPAQVGSDVANGTQRPSGGTSISFSSFITSDSSVFGISGSSTIPIPNYGSVQPTPVTSVDNGINNGVVNATHRKGLPPVGIGLITIALVLIGLFSAVFFTRRIYQRRRADRRTRWAPVMAENGNDSNGPSRSSVRSSFATTFDYGLRAQSPIPTSEMPTLPPLPHLAEPKRASVDSDHSQWLVLDRPQGSEELHGGSGSAPLTPLSVAPFTPSESFKFPQPPRSGQAPDEESPFADYIETPAKPVLIHARDDHTEQCVYSQSSVDDKSVIENGAPVVVRRPFAPSLPDELYVAPGQVVTIEQIFDDGWNLVKTHDGACGLVPLACFEDADRPNGKRRSSLIDFAN